MIYSHKPQRSGRSISSNTNNPPQDPPPPNKINVDDTPIIIPEVPDVLIEAPVPDVVIEAPVPKISFFRRLLVKFRKIFRVK